MKQFLIIFLFLSTGFLAKAQQQNSLFWEISGNGLQKPAYVFGTIHMICKEDFFMPDVVVEKFKASDKVFLEMDMDDAAMQMKLMKLAMLPSGQSLKKIFGDDYQLVDSFFKANSQFPLVMFNGFKPMMVMSLMYLEMLPCDNHESYEQSFIGLAREEKKDIQGLESMEDQMKIFDDIPDSVEAKNIVTMIREFEKQKQQFAEMVKVYKSQNLTKLIESIEGSPDLMNAEEALLTKRNNNWIPVMEKNMKEGGCFFAVGAAHLPGKNGVLELLKKAGYTVKAVKM
ncbi:MAG: TraB/GumN family protein [Chitinophagaceae bacterium]|nr:TraB/GumN family protein [Chitinophagaceae bacterium]